MSSVKDKILSRALQEIAHGMVVNLGIGLPMQIVDYLPDNSGICLHSENGASAFGASLPYEKADRDIIDSGGNYISTKAGTAYFDSAVSFAMVRRGRLDLTLLGAFEVSQNGDLANWKIPGKFAPGAGGAIELAQKSKRVVVLMPHTNAKGSPKILNTCTLPLTARGAVNRIITELGVFDIIDHTLTLIEIAQDIDIKSIKEKTEADFKVDDRLKVF